MTDTVQETIPGIDELIEEASKAPYRTILEIWIEVLKPAEKEKGVRIAPQWSNKIVTSYAELRYEDMGEFRDRFFSKVIDLYDILKAVVSEDDEALKRMTPEEDATLNHHHYLTIIFAWQQRILLWELEWTYDMEHAAVEIAAISEVHKMFFEKGRGLAELLDQIDFQFDDEDRQALVDMLEETKAGAE